MERPLSTNQAAKICRVSQQTIIRCCDSGDLKHWHIPGSRTRRIQPGELRAFMIRYQIPIDDFPAE